MTRSEERLAEAFKKLSASPWIVEVATVKDVDQVNLSCTVELLTDETEIPNVRLKAGIDQVTDGLVQIPEVDSQVLIARINNDVNNRVIVAYSAVSSTLFDGGDNGGLIKIEDMVSKMNAVEGKVNDILQALIGITIPLAPSGTYPLAPSFASIMPLSETVKSDLENEKVKH